MFKFHAMYWRVEHGIQIFTAPQNAGFGFSQYIHKYSIINYAPLTYVFPFNKEYFSPQTYDLCFCCCWNVFQNAGLRTTKCWSESQNWSAHYDTFEVKWLNLMIGLDKVILWMTLRNIYSSIVTITVYFYEAYLFWLILVQKVPKFHLKNLSSPQKIVLEQYKLAWGILRGILKNVV